jgi:hypothetical protein
MRIRPGGYAISFGWNSAGFGVSNGFEIEKVMCLNHGASHNDTIIVIEKKMMKERVERPFQISSLLGLGGNIRRIECPYEHMYKNIYIKELFDRYIGDGRGWIDPYAGTKTLAEITNDINPKAPSMYHLRAVDFAEQLEDDQYNGVLFTPPFNGLHIVSVYKTLNIPLRKNEASCSFYWSVKRTLTPKLKRGAIVISFRWNSTGFGKKLGFNKIEYLLMHHGSEYNDTIVTVERKL